MTITLRVANRANKEGKKLWYLDFIPSKQEQQQGIKRQAKFIKDRFLWDDSLMNDLSKRQHNDRWSMFVKRAECIRMHDHIKVQAELLKQQGPIFFNVPLTDNPEQDQVSTPEPPAIPSTPQPLDFITYLSDFLRYKHRLFQSALNHYKGFLTLKGLITKQNPVLPVDNLTTNILNDYRAYLLETKKQNTALLYFRNVRAAALKLYNKGLAPHLDLDLVPIIDNPDTDRVWLTMDEIRTLGRTPFDPMPEIRQAYLLCCYSAMRIADVTQLRWNMIVKTDGGYQINYRQKKMDRNEFTPIRESVMVSILGEIKKGDDLVFPDLPDAHTMNVLLRNWMTAAGIEKTKPITWHSSKHSCAMMLLKSGVDLYTISKMLNHESIQSTVKYLRMLDEDKIKAANMLPNLIE